MSTAVGRLTSLTSPVPPEPQWVIAAHVARSCLRWGLIWGAVFGLWVLGTVKAFMTGYPTLSERLQLTHSLQAFALFMGLPHRAETVAGFTSWRVLLVIVVIGAIWGLMTSTGALRGEEDAGRWELLLAGRTTRRAATAQALVGLGGVLVAMFAIAALLTIVAGTLPGARLAPGGALLFALAMVSGAAMFGSIGALTSQLAASRGQAASLAALALGASFAMRMLADSTTSLGWLRWLSPLGWVEELRPLQDTQPVALLPMVGLVVGCSGLALHLSAKRDLYASVLHEGAGLYIDPRWLVGPMSLTLRVTGGGTLAWLAGVAGLALVYGSLTRSASNLMASSPSFTAALGRLGVHRATQGYLGVVFLMMAVLIAVLAAGQVAGIRSEESAGRLDNLLVRPVRRGVWLAERSGLALLVVVLAGLIAGCCAWWGASSQHISLSLPTLLSAGLNATVPGIFVLGVGVLVMGIRPTVTAAAEYGVVAWSFLIDLLGSLIKGSDWLRDSSLFSHMALAPAANPDWSTAAVIVALGTAGAVLGIIAFQRRDIEYA